MPYTDLALLVHDVVVLEEVLPDLEVVRLDALLGRLDRARHEPVLDRLPSSIPRRSMIFWIRSEPKIRRRSSSRER
jgi:hypothetical protein